MLAIRLHSVNDLDEWRAAARVLLLGGCPPGDVHWVDPASSPDLFDVADAPSRAVTGRNAGVVPRRFLALAAAAICHSDAERFALLYSLLWRLQKDRAILSSRDDPDVGKLHRRVEAVMAERARMREQLRFRRAVAADGHKGLAAWFEPRHYVLERVAPHFVRENGREQWSIATSYRSAHWDGRILSFSSGGRRPGSAIAVHTLGSAQPSGRSGH